MQRSARAFRAAVCSAVVLAVLFACASLACGANIDVSRRGSISFSIISGYDRIPGGNMKIVRVASLERENEGGYIVYKYKWTPEMTSFPGEPSDAGSFEFAQSVYEYALSRGVEAREHYIDDRGCASFYDLETGLYLFYQTIPAEGYDTIAPFIVSLPMLEGGVYIYDIDASPKPTVVKSTEPATEPTEPASDTPTAPADGTTVPDGTTQSTARPTEPGEEDETTRVPYDEPEETTYPSIDDEYVLPNTGQLKWPIAVLVPSGLVFILLGLIVRATASSKEDP